MSSTTVISDIVRRVKVNRMGTPEASISATRRIQGFNKMTFVEKDVLATMPVGKGPGEVEIVYFCLGHYATAEEVEREYELRGLLPDPQAQAADNGADPDFADQYPNCAQWNLAATDTLPSYASVAFGRWFGERHVEVFRRWVGYNGGMWFGGVRK